jgi:NADPH-dependent glutamate synthase beta subunit-like oxidoreductase/Pyruvate/2-oxoacid:ferredoxin oxidoreductase delta subunit
MGASDSTLGGRVPPERDAGEFHLKLRQPEQLAKLPPCQSHCPGSGDIRSWVGIVAQREKIGLTAEDAYARAWRVLVEKNPFPATMGRVCPHPCEAGCNRNDKDGAVAINALERFLGDWALGQRLPLPRETSAAATESIGVIGSGPAGLSFAYQMARRGYPVTVYESHAKLGGMLTYGIPEYRLPERVVGAEIQRILDLGVRVELDTAVGRDITVAELHERHALVFLGIGAQKGRLMDIPGEDGPGVWAGTTYLELVNDDQPVALGGRVVVVGGGNTAIDAARAVRRQGAEVTLLYRRTRAEMPAIASEVEDATREGVRIEYLAAPIEIVRDSSVVRAVRVQTMALGEPDASGRRRPVPVAGAVQEIAADAVVVAVSQEPDWEGLDGVEREGARCASRSGAWIGEDVLAGGDVVGLGIASLAIAQGRLAAEAAHARLRGLADTDTAPSEPISSARLRLDYYPGVAPTEPPRRPSDKWLASPDEEITGTISEQDFLNEVGRCLSCGLCFGCQHCMMYCNPCGFTRIAEPRPGAYFALALDRCEGCGKCIEVCPCGFLSPLG